MVRVTKGISRSTQERVDRYSPSRIRKQQWVDPFPSVQGTLPEKMVYAELSRRGIAFAFQNEVPFVIPEIDFSKDYRPDIIIPALKIIIEVQGSFWHSKPEAIDADAYKFAVYEMTGWRVLVWWDYDIMSRLLELFAEEPAFYYRTQAEGYNAEFEYTKKINRDDSKGIVTMNRNRGLRQSYKKPSIRQRLTRRRRS